MTPEERKERSEKILREHGIKVNPYLPLVESEEEADFRKPEEIAERASAALLVSNTAIDIAQGSDIDESREFFAEHLKRLGLYDILTDDEKIIMESDDIEQSFAVNMTWRIERCVPLFRSCGFIDSKFVFPKEPFDCVPVVKMIVGCKDHDELLSHINMRPNSEILDNTDLIYRMDWACVESRIKENSTGGLIGKLFKKNNSGISGISADLNHDVTVEQHKGYNWLTGVYEEGWDDIPADT